MAEQKEKMVKIRIPRVKGDSNDDVYVSINERTWLIQRGVDVEVPECVAALLNDQAEAEDAAYRFSASKQH